MTTVPPADPAATRPPPPHFTAQLAAWDREFLWHPFTPMKPWIEDKEIIVIERGQGEFLFDTEGRRYIDGVSSLWCNVHGHCVPELDAAVRDQLGRIAHSTLLGLANVPSVLLAKRLIDLVRACGLHLDKVFYSDNGSTAVEVACKMAYQFWRNTHIQSPFSGRPRADASPANPPNPPPPPWRSRFIAFHSSYHGDTLGAVSLGGIPLFHHAFQGLTFPVDFVPPPTRADEGRAVLVAIESLLTARPETYAAIVIEPLVLGAGGMLMYPPTVLAQLRQLATRHRTLLIADEVLTGFGRTGQMFAWQHALPPLANGKWKMDNSTGPDLLCLSKGLTAGYMPLGATLATQRVFDAFYADPRAGKTFFHGHTFTGHPLACAVALASLDLMDQNRTLEHVQRLGPIMDEILAPAAASPYVADVRRLGLIAAIDLARDRTGTPFPAHWRIGGALCTRMRQHGVMLRPLADTLVIMPPLAIREENLRHLCQVVLESLADIPALLRERTARDPQPETHT